MRKIYLYIAAFLLTLAMAAGFAACGDKENEGGSGFALAEGANMVWLDRYEEAEVALASGDAAALDWSSANESVVTVDKGLLIAQGEGETIVTVTDGSTSAEISVKVRDSGIKPRFSFRETDAFLNVSTAFPNTITYNDKIYTPELDYTITFEDETYAAYADGQITGLKLGSTSADISAQYKGLTLEATITVNVKEPLNLEFAADEIELYNVEGKFGEAELDAKALYLGEEVADAAISYEAIEGAECVSIQDGVLYAEKEGTAIVQASYTDGGHTAQAFLGVTVHPNYIETSYENVSFHDIIWAETDETIGGRTGVTEYKAGADITPNTCFDHRVVEAHSGDKLLDLYADGYRYFAYDLYYTSNQNLMIGCGAFTSWLSVGDYFRKDYFKIISDGKVTNTLEKNTWMTMVYDLKALWMMDMGKTADFFFFVNDATTSQYITDVRFYLDDAFIPDENLVYEDEGDYIQATNDEFDVMVPVSKNYSMDTGLPSTVVDPEEVPLYGLYGESVGGRNGVYRYETRNTDGWLNSLIVATSMNETYDDSMYALNSRGSYLTFDIYPEQGETLVFRMNYLANTATVKVGSTNLGQFDGWLCVIRDGKVQNTIEANVWQTVCIAYSDNYSEDAIGGSITFSAEEEGSVVYIDDVRYRKNGDFIPTEYAEETYAPVLDKTSANISLERVTTGSFKGAYLYKDGESSANAENGLTFKQLIGSDGAAGKFYRDGYQYIRVQVYFAENVTSLVLSVSGGGLNGYTKEIVLGETFEGIPVFTEAGVQATVLSAKTWYELYIPVTYDGQVTGEADVRLGTKGGTAAAPASVYLKNVSFEVSVQTPYLREGTSGVSLALETEGTFKGTWKYVNRTSGEEEGEGQNWGESGVLFSRVTKSDGSGPDAFFTEGYHWIKVDIYAAENVNSISVRSTADRNYTSYWERQIGVGASLYNFSLYLFDGSERVDRFERNTWYTLYIPVDYSSLDIGYVYIMLYTNGGSSAAPAVMYLKNIEYVKDFDMPALVMDDGTPIGRTNDGWDTYVSVEEITSGEFAGAYEYVNKSGGQDEDAVKNNWGESGVYFYNVVNPNNSDIGTFFTDGYKWLKVPVYFVSGADTFSISVHADRNLTLYWPQLIPIGEPISESLKGQVYAIDADGNRAEIIEAGEWYDLYIPVDYSSTDVGYAYVNIYTNGGTVEEPSVMYVKTAEFLENYTVPEYPEQEEPADPSVGNLYVRDEYKAAGLNVEQDAEGMWTYTSPLGGLDGTEGTDLYYGEAGVFFMEISSSGTFFTNGYRLIRLEIKAGANVNSITLRFGQNPTNSYWVEKIEVGQPLPQRAVYLYDMNGQMVQSLERDTWYTLYIPVEDATAFNSIQINGGSQDAPAVMYLKNIKYVNAISETSSYILGDSVTTNGTEQTFTSNGTEKMYVSGLQHPNAACAFESMGEFYRAGFHVVKMNVKFGDNASVLTFVHLGDSTGWSNEMRYTFTVGGGVEGNALILDEEGYIVTTIERGVWYSIYLYVDYTNTSGWANFNATLSCEAVGTPATLTVSDVMFMEKLPAAEEKPQEPVTAVGNLYVREDYKEKGVSLEQGEDGVWTYTNKTNGIDGGENANWGESGVFFMEISASDSFFTDGYRLIRLQIMAAENVTSVTLRFGQSATNSYWIESIVIGQPLPARTIYLYDAEGNMAESMQRNVWYTLYIPVEDATAFNCIQSNGGTSAAPAVTYLKNVTYVKAISETSSYIFGNTVTEGEEGKVFTSVNGQETMLVNGVTRSGAVMAFESTGEFFRAGFHVIKMDVKFGDAVSYLTFMLKGTVTGNAEVWYSFTVGQGAGANTMILDESGNSVGTIEKGKWYSIYMYLDYSATEGWTDFLGYLGGGSEGAPATLTVRNVEFMNDFPQA